MTSVIYFRKRRDFYERTEDLQSRVLHTGTSDPGYGTDAEFLQSFT